MGDRHGNTQERVKKHIRTHGTLVIGCYPSHRMLPWPMGATLVVGCYPSHVRLRVTPTRSHDMRASCDQVRPLENIVEQTPGVILEDSWERAQNPIRLLVGISNAIPKPEQPEQPNQLSSTSRPGMKYLLRENRSYFDNLGL